MSPLKLDGFVCPAGISQPYARYLIDFIVIPPRSSDPSAGLLRGEITRGIEA
jgi:hypothetical protein